MASRRVRAATEDDAPAIRDIYAPFVRDTVISFEFEPPDALEIRRRIAATAARLPWLVCDDATGVVGYAYASPYRARAAYGWSIEVSVYLGDEVRRSGVGRRLYTALLQLLERQGYRNAYAGITLPNPASVDFHRALGFSEAGVLPRVGYKLGVWCDVAWWHRALCHDDKPPGPLRSYEDVAGEADWGVW